MKNLKFEILLDGKPKVAYVRPENKNKFLKKYQNNFPKEVINAEELEFEIKANSLGKSQGTVLSQNNQQQNTEFKSEDTSSGSQGTFKSFNIEDHVKSITQFNYKPEPGSNLTYDQQITDPKTDEDDDEDDGFTLNLENAELQAIEQDQKKFENLFNKYNPQIDGKRLSQQDFFLKSLQPEFKSKHLDPDLTFKDFITKSAFKLDDSVLTLNGLYEDAWVSKNTEKYGGKDQAQKAWIEQSFLASQYFLTEQLVKDLKNTQGLSTYDVKSMYKFNKAQLSEDGIDDETLEEYDLEAVDLIAKDPNKLVFVPEVGGEDVTWQRLYKREEENYLNAFENYMGTTLAAEKATLEVKQKNETLDLFKSNRKLKKFKNKTLEKVEEKFKEETETLNAAVDKELSTFRETLMQELNEKYPNGPCRTAASTVPFSQIASGDAPILDFGVNTECYNPEDLEPYSKRLQKKEEEIKKDLNYDNLLNKKASYQQELFERNADYVNHISRQTEEYNTFIENAYENFLKTYKPKLNHWDKKELDSILANVLSLPAVTKKSIEPEQKKIIFQQILDQYLDKEGANLSGDQRNEYELEFWTHMYKELRTTEQDREQVSIIQALDGRGNPTTNRVVKTIKEDADSQFFFETMADEFISMATDAMDRNRDVIIVNKDTLNDKSGDKFGPFTTNFQKDIKNLPTSIVSGIQIKDGATYNKNNKTINGNREISWNGKQWSFEQTHTYEIKEYTDDLIRIKELLYDQMEDRGFTKEQIQILEEGGQITLKVDQVNFKKKLSIYQGSLFDDECEGICGV